MKSTTQTDVRDGVTDLLVVEDNPADIRFIEEVCNRSSLAVIVHSVSTSAAGLDFVHQRGRYTDAPEPDIVFLDWHFERSTEKAVLTALHAEFDNLLVVVLTESSAALEATRSPPVQVDLLTKKPTDPDRYIEIIRSLATDG